MEAVIPMIYTYHQIPFSREFPESGGDLPFILEISNPPSSSLLS